MEAAVIFTILYEVIGIFFIILLIIPSLLSYVGLNKTGLVLTIMLHFLGGYIMFFV
jgi:hypothetical protein